MDSDLLIIGGGHAGAMTAIMLRKYQFKGSITILSDENYIPYQKPPLSKDFLTKSFTKESLYFRSEDYFGKNNILIHLNTRVISIDRKNKKIVCESNEFFYRN